MMCGWKDSASPEDIEYYECQMELYTRLLMSYNNLERIIGTEIKICIVNICLI